MAGELPPRDGLVGMKRTVDCDEADSRSIRNVFESAEEYGPAQALTVEDEIRLRLFGAVSRGRAGLPLVNIMNRRQRVTIEPFLRRIPFGRPVTPIIKREKIIVRLDDPDEGGEMSRDVLRVAVELDKGAFGRTATFAFCRKVPAVELHSIGCLHRNVFILKPELPGIRKSVSRRVVEEVPATGHDYSASEAQGEHEKQPGSGGRERGRHAGTLHLFIPAGKGPRANEGLYSVVKIR